MACDGLSKKAINGKCRICLRVRKTHEHLKAVGEVRHGFALGHIWECIDAESCDEAANKKINSPKTNDLVKHKLQTAKSIGRYNEYKYIN